MSKRRELLDATDDYIESSIKYADPMVLRGLLFQLTGDEDLVDIGLGTITAGFLDIKAVLDESAVALISSKAAAFLKSYRDKGAPDITHGPADRLRKSISMTVGEEVPESELEMWMEQLALDPWARSLVWKEGLPSVEQLNNFKVAVIGAGMGGLNAAIELKRAGIPYFVIEKNSDVGGTWHENRYPGARVDSPSRIYNHTYGVNFPCPYAFCPQRENLQYLEWMADDFGLRGDIVFDTEVRTVIWDDSAKLWEITSFGPDGPRIWRANAIISAVGFLSRPNVPLFDGIENFAGRAFHTARWPTGLELKDKRVAVIGSGATGYQMVAELAKLASHVYVYQRSPSWCVDVPGYLDPFPEQVNWLDRNFPFLTNFIRLRLSWIGGPQSLMPSFLIDPDFKDPNARSAGNKKIRDQRIAFIQRKLASRPELIEKMIPKAPPLSARWVVIDSNYNIFDALLRDNVTLVTDPIDKITEDRILVQGGGSYPADIIVYATGFRANDFLWPMEIRGRGGQRVQDLWSKDGARAYVGAMLPGFPNFFTIYGPNTNNFGGLQVVDLQALVTRFALECIGGLITGQNRAVDVATDAYWRYNTEVDRCESRMIYSDPRATTYYKNEFGRSSANCPIDIRRMWRWLRSPAAEPSDQSRYEDCEVRPCFGEDLLVE